MKEESATRRRGDPANPDAHKQRGKADPLNPPVRRRFFLPRHRGAGSPRREQKLPLYVQRLLAPYFPDFDLERVRVRDGIPWYVLMDADGYTDRHRICFRSGCFDCDSPAGIALIGHEVMHCWQYHQFGTWRFRALYIGHWLREFVRTRSLTLAYWNIPFEAEARAVEQQIHLNLLVSLPGSKPPC